MMIDIRQTNRWIVLLFLCWLILVACGVRAAESHFDDASASRQVFQCVAESSGDWGAENLELTAIRNNKLQVLSLIEELPSGRFMIYNLPNQPSASGNFFSNGERTFVDTGRQTARYILETQGAYYDCSEVNNASKSGAEELGTN